MRLPTAHRLRAAPAIAALVLRALRAALAIAALALLALTATATGGAAQGPGRPWLTGHLLVATEAIGDPRFVRTVVYVVRHDAQGALGVVINRPLGDVSFESALRPFAIEVPPGSGDVRIHYGGPVEPNQGSVLHTAEWTGEGTGVVDGRFAFTTSPKILQAMARGSGPRRAIFLLGYAGWAPGQLEAELAKDAWGVALPDEALVFNADPERIWTDATARRLLDL
jgi:putative transcriptional regulator